MIREIVLTMLKLVSGFDHVLSDKLRSRSFFLEQILSIDNHVLSFVQTRGSVPCFWSQPGYKYKPQPIIDKPKTQSLPAFQRHFEEQSSLYGRQILVNLVDQTGKEKVLSDAYLDHVVEFNRDGITYVAFDFHDYCRGMKFENVSILLSAVTDLIQQLKFCWVDKRREIACEQDGVFRVNCVDCLDRTNVVQTAIARVMLEIQFRKFGLLLPDQFIPRECQSSFQVFILRHYGVILASSLRFL